MRVEPLRLEWIEALIDSDAAFTERFGIAVIDGWAGFPEALPHALDAARRHNADPWGSHLFFDDDGALVGFGGFKGPPADGTVAAAEIGALRHSAVRQLYRQVILFPCFAGRGYTRDSP